MSITFFFFVRLEVDQFIHICSVFFLQRAEQFSTVRGMNKFSDSFFIFFIFKLQICFEMTGGPLSFGAMV